MHERTHSLQLYSFALNTCTLRTQAKAQAQTQAQADDDNRRIDFRVVATCFVVAGKMQSATQQRQRGNSNSNSNSSVNLASNFSCCIRILWAFFEKQPEAKQQQKQNGKSSPTQSV